MGTHTIKLSAEELALIEQKRAEEKAQKEALLKSYDHYKKRNIEAEQKRVQTLEKEQEERKKLFEKFFAQLTSVSPDFKFDCKCISKRREINLYDIDDSGNEIKYIFDEQGIAIDKLEPKETINFEYVSYELKISYTGKLPETHEFYVIPVEQVSKYSRNVIGHKMQIQGTGINSWEKKGQMTKPESVVKKLKELSESAFMKIEFQEAENVRKNTVEAEFKKQYGHLENEASVVVKGRQFTITFNNGIEIILNGYLNGDKVSFTHSKTSMPYGVDVNKLINALKNI